MKYLLFGVLLCAITASRALVINPIIDTDKSVNTYSVQSIAADLVKPAMADIDKLKALFSFHRRMMHHYRFIQTTEDGTTAFDPIKMYTVYGCSFCTQQATVFRTLTSEVFGWQNTEGTAGSGTLASLGVSGGHSSFHLRFNDTDTWHWVDPIIGAYALNKSNGTIATMEEIVADPSILADAEKDGRASIPFFPCTKGANSIDTTVPSAYSYFDYDSVFIREFASAYTPNQYTTQKAYFTTRKTLHQGEKYLFFWDYLDGNYFNLNDTELGKDSAALPTRDWKWYPPRHLCGWKDSLDTVNWPYFKPYKKVIKGDTCYRYYANGTHTYEPNLRTKEPKDGTYSLRNISFFADDASGPGLKPAAKDSLCEIAWRFKLPYPLMSMRLSGSYIKRNASDSISVSIKRLRFISRDDKDKTKEGYPNYRDTLTADTNYRLIMSLPASDSAAFDTTLRQFVDPLNTGRTYQGYQVKLTMKARGAASDLGFSRLKIECIFEHNMFALPQLEPGPNIISLTADSTDLIGENLKVAFSWMDNGTPRLDSRPVSASPAAYTITVNQAAIPKMLFMGIANTVGPFCEPIGVEKAKDVPLEANLFTANPNPFNPRVKFVLSGNLKNLAHPAIRIYDSRGGLIETLAMPGDARAATWNAGNRASGVYLACLQAGKTTLTRKILLIK